MRGINHLQMLEPVIMHESTILASAFRCQKFALLAVEVWKKRSGVAEAKRRGRETDDLDDTGFQISISLAKILFVDDGGDEMSTVSRVYAERGLTELQFVSGWVWRVQSGFKQTSCKRLSWRLRSSGDVVG
ncbi:hypothetical protein Bca4012_007445 [Brassica carinata]